MFFKDQGHYQFQ